MHPEATVFAFEPLSQMASKFEAMFHGDHLVTLHRLAAGSESGTFNINVSARPDSSSPLPITNRQSEIYPGTAAASIEAVTVSRVENVINPADLRGTVLIKLDVQGFELQALKGMTALLERADYVYAEASFVELYGGQPLAHEIVEWLAARSYRLAGIHNVSAAAAGYAVQADFLFIHERPEQIAA